MDISQVLAQLGVPLLLVAVVVGATVVLIKTGVIRSARIHVSVSIWMRRAKKAGATKAELKALVISAAKFDMKK